MGKIEQAADIISTSQRIVFFTGAGACTDSGIPDYRDIGSSYWSKYNPKDFIFEQFIRSEESRKEYWRMDQDFLELVKNARPNPLHYALVELEHTGKLLAIITQNVDGLHQQAGSLAEIVIEIHGNIFTVSCLQCTKRCSRQEIYERLKSGTSVPYCSFCHGILKPDTVLFGQPMPQIESARALKATLQSDLFVVVGSSLLVQPASYLIIKAKEVRTKIMIINLNSTPYDIYANLVIYDNAASVMSQIMNTLPPPPPRR